MIQRFHLNNVVTVETIVEAQRVSHGSYMRKYAPYLSPFIIFTYT